MAADMSMPEAPRMRPLPAATTAGPCMVLSNSRPPIVRSAPPKVKPAREAALGVPLNSPMSVAAGAALQLAVVAAELKAINQKLWVIEDDIRDCERAKDFGTKFVELARAVYFTNDERAALKRKVNDLLGSALIEEKSYAPY